MGEEKVGLIPRVVVVGSWATNEYGVLITNERSIFVLEKTTKTGTGYVIGGVVGAAIAHSMADGRKRIDYNNRGIESLASSEESISIPHGKIKRMRLKKGFSVYNLLLEYSGAGGKAQKMKAQVAPPPEYIQKRKTEGVKSKVALQEYIQKVQRAYQRALPLGVQQRVEWAL